MRHDPARLVPLQHWEIWKVGEARQCVPPADDMDVAALALESAEVLQALRRTWIFLSLSHLISPYREVAEYVVAGYPDEAPVDIGDQRTFPLRVFITRRIPPPSNVAWETPPNVDIDLFLEYAETGTDSSREEVRTPPLRGVSGAVVWAVLPSQGTPVVWTPTGPTIPRMRVAAIQSSYSHRSFIRAKKLNVLEPVIRALDTQAASRIGGVLRGGPL